ncbi:Hypothetical protein NTJ_11759 [Nesidiocoris tenuis]|uniref:Uncharacterized protein n=1 Tax=Nesidiocoris tenuis TaxID=355587 RepID=A0ABN7B524_9HEMI|nr:Hypothetical protein NTJ_11759 [Nesidiocoris tenuis]
MPVGGRVAGKVGIYSSVRDGGNLSGLNEEIIWCSIILSIIIAVLITVALCYLAREKCKKRNEYLAAT